MLRCAARISSGSACASAFNAASRSPRLIASSTVRTAPRISVRRDLLIAVRRAILRVAFLAEVVLAIVSKSLRVSSAFSKGARRPLHERDRRCRCFGTFPRVPLLEQICSRRLRPKNSGGGIAPAAIGALIEAGYWSVNAFRRDGGADRPLQNTGKVLTRLNFRCCPGRASRD